MLAYLESLRGRKQAASAASEKAIATSKASSFALSAARTLADVGEMDRARKLTAVLASDRQIQAQAYARLAEGHLALRNKDPRAAIKLLDQANALVDTWLGHFDLGLAYLEDGQFAQADSEFDQCVKRRGEALSLFLDEQSTFGYFPAVYYYHGRAREGLKTERFADSYRRYIDIRGDAGEDPLLSDARRRLEHSPPN